MSSSEGSITAFSDLEIRERGRAMRDARPATPPPASDDAPRVRITPPPALPREVVEARAVESVATVSPLAMYPRAGAALLALELADRCRCAATLLDAAAASAPDLEPSTLRRHVAAIVRALVSQLGERVVL